jgi:hypothetical protein
MDWIPALSTTSLLALALWLFRNLISTILTNSVKHEYDIKIEQLKNELRQNEESFKADLRAKETQIDALRNGALSGISNRQAAIFERQLTAIEQLWDSIISLGPAKSVSAWMAVVKFEAAAKEAAKNPRFREMFSMIGNVDLRNLQTNQALKARPFISPLAWAYYSAYQAIVIHAVVRLQMLKNGVNMVEVIDTENVTKLVKVALPHQIEYIEKYGPGAFHYLLEELETNLLLAFKLMLKGEESDKETMEKAAAIIRESEKLMDSNASTTTEE